MKGSFVILTVIAAILFISAQSEAKTFYLKNGDEIEYQSYKQRGGVVYLQINQDSEVEFPVGEVDLARTAKANGEKITAHPAKVKKHVIKRAADKTPKQGVPAKVMGKAAPGATPAVPEKPGHAANSASVAPVPAKAGPPTSQAGTPALRQELDAVYGKYFAAMRSGDSRESLKYVVGEQRKQLEQLEKLPKEQKKQMTAMLKEMLAGGYKTTGCTVAPDGKRATLNFTRKVPSVSYESGKDASGKETMVQKGETVYKDSNGTVDFVKVGNEWKIERNKEILNKEM